MNAGATIGDLRRTGRHVARATCRCGRTRTIDLVRERPEARLADLGQRLVCEGCGARGPTVELEPAAAGDALPAGVLALTRGRHVVRVAVVGSAGRLDDAARIGPGLWRAVLERAGSWTKVLQGSASAVHLVSGGSAFADHLAVRLFLDGRAEGLTLHLPAAFDREARRFAGGPASPGTRLNALHEAFAQAAGVPSLAELAEAIGRRASVTARAHDGFEARNRAIAADCETLVAFTFGPKSFDVRPGRQGWRDAARAGLKAGGTAHTWEADGRARRKIHVAIGELARTPGTAP